ncbi:MAG TPA: hypothetical protein VGA02_09685 [Gemmatimonadales bacterium]
MATGKRRAPWLTVALLVAACGGAEEAPPPGQPAVEPPPPTSTPAPADTGGQAAAASALEISREVFAYRGSGRDPFVSLLRSGNVRPLPQDLRVVGITFDPRYPQRSVAVLHDISDMRRFTVRPGDVVGRVRIVEVRATEVIAVVQEFGVDRQVVLPLRRRQEASQ